MVFHTYKVERYSVANDGTYDASPTELTKVLSIGVNEGIGDRADSFDITFHNSSETLFNETNLNDRLVISLSYDGSTFTQLIDGLVESKVVNDNVKSPTFVVSGLNRLEKLFNALVQTTGENIPHTADFWIQQIIDQVNDANELKIGWHADNVALPDSAAVSFIRDYSRAFSLIEELSQPELTDGRNFIYYLDSNNDLVWVERPEAVSNSLKVGTDLRGVTVTKGVFNVVNSLLVNAGKSPYGNTIIVFEYDVLSVNKNGWKTKPVLAEAISNRLQSQEWANMKDRGVFSDGSNFPSSYTNYVATWGAAIASDSEFNSGFVDEVRTVAKNKAKAIIRNLAHPNFKTKGTYVFDTSDSPGNKVTINSDLVSWTSDNPKELRVQSVNYSFSAKSGWVVDFNISEDSDAAAITLTESDL